MSKTLTREKRQQRFVATAPGRGVETYVLALTVLRLATVALGLVFVWGAWRSYRRFRSPSMLWLLVAICLLVLAVLAEGAAVRILGWPLSRGHVVEAVVSLLGFMALVVSVRVRARVHGEA